MKKLFFFTVALFATITSSAQFKTIPGGMTAAEGEKAFVVFQVDGSQQELFAKCKTAVTAVYKSAKDVMSYNEPEIISIHGFTDNLYYKMGIKQQFCMRYIIKFQFKEGKIRVDAPSVELSYPPRVRSSISLTCGGAGMNGDYHLYKKDGSERNSDALRMIEAEINGIVNTIIEKIKMGEQAAEEDW